MAFPPPTTDPSALSPAARDAAIRRMGEETLDVLVVGGGVVGAGCALDAATRGLDVAVVEARDWASGTSSRSSKLIHGGLRYLEQLELHLVREALTERTLMLRRLCPHLVRPVSFLYPLTRRGWQRPYVGAGLLLYDTLGVNRERGLPRHRHLDRSAVAAACPALRPDAHRGGMLYWDAQVDDARHTMTVVRTAAAYGVAAANRAQVVALRRHGQRVTGAVVRDLESGLDVEVRARRVVNATGVWTDEVQRLAADQAGVRVRASKGVHVVVPRDRIQSEVGLILRTPMSVLFVIPWGRHWLIGTTDTDWELDRAHPAASSADIDYLLDRLNAVLLTPLTRDDIEGVYAGLRPLLAGESSATSELSREHTVAVPAPGLVVVAGGKYTTYRVMARDAIDAAVGDWPGAVPASCTDQVPLLGADGWPEVRDAAGQLAAGSGLAPERIEHLLGRYGSRIHELLELVAADPGLASPLPGGTLGGARGAAPGGGAPGGVAPG
ncbi:MAG: glycerol-3-phosphate dehydrogenase/oxidase, partial [Acidimicrobiales bacterium]